MTHLSRLNKFGFLLAVISGCAYGSQDKEGNLITMNHLHGWGRQIIICYENGYDITKFKSFDEMYSVWKPKLFPFDPITDTDYWNGKYRLTFIDVNECTFVQIISDGANGLPECGEGD